MKVREWKEMKKRCKKEKCEIVWYRRELKRIEMFELK